MNLIAFTGQKYNGKTTAGEAFMEMAKYPHRLSFAQPLKRALHAMGFTHEEVYGSAKDDVIEKFGVSFRRLAQTLGTDWGRNMIHKDIWLFMFERQYMLQVQSGTDLVIVDDVRYENEADLIKSLGGMIIRVVRPDIISVDDHSSEFPLPDKWIDWTLRNDTTKVDFELHCRNMAYHIMNPTIPTL